MSQNRTIITNAMVFDGHDIHENLSITIENGLIAAIDKSIKMTEPPNTTIIDATGQTLLPGFIDAHVHLAGDLQSIHALLKQMAKAGITTALDMGFLPKSTREALKGQPGMVEVRSAGNFATATGSTHSRMPFVTKESIIDTLEDGVAFVQARIAEDADYIKIVADVPGPSQEVVNTIATETRKAGKLSIAHAARKAAFAMAQEGNVDIITHVPLDSPLTEKEAKLMKENGRVCVPTLIMERGIAGAGFAPGLQYSAAKESVTQLHKAGVSIVVGTDSNSHPRMAVKHGESFHEELALLVDAGMSNLEVLRAATSVSAEAFKLNDRGEIEVGKRADLVLVGGNPAEDIATAKDVKRVWIAGSEVVLN